MVEIYRACAQCGVWVYFDNGDCTFHCLCGVGWKWRQEPQDGEKEVAK